MSKLDTYGVGRVAKATQTKVLMELVFLCILVLVPDKRKFPPLHVGTGQDTHHRAQCCLKKSLAWPLGKNRQPQPALLAGEWQEWGGQRI